MTDHSDDIFPDGTRRAEGDIVLAGRYKVLRELGHGAMGTVYLAEDLTLDGVHVAIKTPPAIVARDRKAVAQLKKEALLARKLSHPHVVTLRTFEQTDDGVFLVMDYIEGQTLEHHLLDHGAMSEAAVLELFTPLAEGLDYAHREGVIHRDIKPSNIMIRSDGTPFIADFGIARELKDTMTRMTSAQTSGTLPYMSPEQLLGDDPAPPQDIYGLAATMYECIGGHPPFHRGEIAYQIQTAAPKPLAQSGMPLAKSIMQALAKDAAQRPASCCALLGRPAQGVGRAKTASGRRGHEPRAVRGWALAAVALIVLAIGAWALLTGGASEEGRGQGVLPETSRGDRDEPNAPGTASPDQTPPPTKPPAVPATATLGSPADGAWSNTQSIRISGRVGGDPTPLFVNGEMLRVSAGTFQHDLAVESDGKLRIQVTTADGSVLATRTIHVDSTLPVIEIISPPEQSTAVDQSVVRIEGLINEAHLATLMVNGIHITPESSGRFTWPVTLEAGLPMTLSFGATDEAGNTAVAVARELIYEEPAEPWEAPLAAALAAASNGTWREAARRLDEALEQGMPASGADKTLTEGVARWKAPPKLELTSPKEGARIQGLEVRLEGRLQTGRKDDGLTVDGKRVVLAADGRFSMPLRYAKPGKYTIKIGVLDDRGKERVGATLTLTLLKPEAYVPTWANVSRIQVAGAKKYGVPVGFENDLGMRFVLIPAGEFWMGTAPTDKYADEDDLRHRVRLTKPYYMQVTEVTNAHFRRWRSSHDSGSYKRLSLNADDQPVVRVSWGDIAGFVEWLSLRDPERTYALPTEAMWEHACRAGTTTRFWWGDSETQGWRYANAVDPLTKKAFGLPQGAWPRDDGHRVTALVGSYEANHFGLHDMLGNVLEQCRDWYAPYPSSSVRDPTGPTKARASIVSYSYPNPRGGRLTYEGPIRISRGGSFEAPLNLVRSAARAGAGEFHRDVHNGMRLVVPLRSK